MLPINNNQFVKLKLSKATKLSEDLPNVKVKDKNNPISVDGMWPRQLIFDF